MGAGQSAQIDELMDQTSFSREELQRMLVRFRKLDQDGSGSIDVEEFMSVANIAKNPVATRVISVLDEDNGGTVDFPEFVRGLSIFSAKGNNIEKLRFAFRVYDMDRDGYISNGELFIVLKMMVGDNLKDDQLQQVVDKTIMYADKDGDDRISFEEFCAVVQGTDIVNQLTIPMS